MSVLLQNVLEGGKVINFKSPRKNFYDENNFHEKLQNKKVSRTRTTFKSCIIQK